MNDKTLTAIIGQAAARTIKDGIIDLNALMKNLCGSYTIKNGKEVIKNDPIPEKPAADGGRDA